MEKFCKKCGEFKDLSCYSKDRSKKDGLQLYCKPCYIEMHRSYRATNSGAASMRRTQLKRLYGITVEEYDLRLKQQNGVCAICGNPETQNKRLAVDHCHDTGKVRGLLCQACNVSLGKFKDSTALLESAIKYLKEHQNA